MFWVLFSCERKLNVYFVEINGLNYYFGDTYFISIDVNFGLIAVKIDKHFVDDDILFKTAKIVGFNN